jgi:hypothetical protein
VHPVRGKGCARLEQWARMKHQSELARLSIDERLENLLDAALAGNAATIRAILDADPEVTRRSVHVAAAVGDADVALALLDADASRATQRGGTRQWTALFYTCSARHGRGDPAVAAARSKGGRALPACARR